MPDDADDTNQVGFSTKFGGEFDLVFLAPQIERQVHDTLHTQQ